MQTANTDKISEGFDNLFKIISEKIPELAGKYKATEDEIKTSLSVQIYRNFERFKDKGILHIATTELLDSMLKFSYYTPIFGSEKGVSVVPVIINSTPVFISNTEYNCIGTLFYKAEGDKNLSKKWNDYKTDIEKYRKSMSRGKRKIKKPEHPNPFAIIDDGVLVCGNKDGMFKLGFFKPQQNMDAKETSFSGYCSNMNCIANTGLQKKRIYEIGAEEFIEYAEASIKENGVDTAEVGREISDEINKIANTFIPKPERENVSMYG